MKLTIQRISMLAALGTLTCMYSKGQVAPSVAKGNFELGLFAGESYGLDKLRPMFGGNVAYATSRFWYPFAEASYLPGINRVFETTGDGTVLDYSHYKINMTDVHAGVHMRLVPSHTKIVPYIVAGLGIIRSSSTSAQVYELNGLNMYVPTATPQPIPSQTSFAVNFGGGLRYFFTEKIGVRLEFKAFIPTSSPTDVSRDVVYRLAIGPVFQIR